MLAQLPNARPKLAFMRIPAVYDGGRRIEYAPRADDEHAVAIPPAMITRSDPASADPAACAGFVDLRTRAISGQNAHQTTAQ